MLELTIRREGSLGSVTRQTITEAQANCIYALLKQDELTYGEVLNFLATRSAKAFAELNDDDFTGAGDSVEAYRG